MPNLSLSFDANKYRQKQVADFFEFCDLATLLIHNMNFNSKCDA